jgi:hypothetical protein
VTATIIVFPAARRPQPEPETATPEPTVPDYRQQFLDMFVPSSHPLAVASRKPRRKSSKAQDN